MSGFCLHVHFGEVAGVALRTVICKSIQVCLNVSEGEWETYKRAQQDNIYM